MDTQRNDDTQYCFYSVNEMKKYPISNLADFNVLVPILVFRDFIDQNTL